MVNKRKAFFSDYSKKSILIFLSVICCLIGCKKDILNCTISNESSYTVSFEFCTTYSNEFTLQPGETKIYDDIAQTDINYFKVNGTIQNEKRTQVEYIHSFGDGKYIDFTPIVLKVYNTLAVPASLTANGYMENEPMSLDAESIDKENTIFTRKPIFDITTNSYPATVDYEIKNDIMYVTIH